MAVLHRLITLLMALLALLPTSALQQPAPAMMPATSAPAAILIGLRPDVPAPADGGLPYGVARSLAVSGYTQILVAPGAAPLYQLRLEPGANLATALTNLQADPALAFAELDAEAIALGAPNDPSYPQQWGLATIGSEAAWAITQGSPDTVVAVIDAGLDVGHPDLVDRLWTNPGEIAGNGQDDDSNGLVDDISGWNFLGTNADLSDSTGHGTQVAGVVAASMNNGQGVAGVCPSCRLMVLKVLRSDGTANYSDIAAAVGYAAQKGADVINLSLGGTSDSAALRSAVAAAARTAVVVAGAGNGNTSAPFFPAAYDEHVLAVAATGRTDAKTAGSNYGPWVDVAAPGEEIYTTLGGGGYGNSSGTSIGTPFASGLAGLLLSAHPEWSPADVRAQIIRTAANIDAANPGLNGQLGGGRLAAASALTAAPAPQLRVAAVTLNGQPGGRPEPGSTASIVVTLANNWFTLAGATATLNGPGVTQASAELGTVPALGTQTSATAFTINVAANAGYNAPLAYTLHVTAPGGFSTDLPLTIITSPGVTDVGATITTQTWTADRVYKVNGETGIPAGQTLTIQPGTVVRFAATGKLRVQGTLIADGSVDRPIIFASQDPTQAWAGITFEDSSQDASFGPDWTYLGGSILRHVKIENGAVTLTSSAPYIAGSSFGLSKQADFNYGAGPTMYGALNGQLGASSAIVGNRFERLNVSVTAPGIGDLLIADNILDDASMSAGTSGGILELRGNKVTISEGGSPYPGISVGGAMTVTNNLVIGGGGMRVSPQGTAYSSATMISGNLVVNSTGPGLDVDAYLAGGTLTSTLTVSANTLIDNATAALQLSLNSIYGQVSPLLIRDNNFVVPPNSYGLRLSENYTATVDAVGNYWRGVNPAVDEKAIYDSADKYGLGTVSYDPPIAAPAAAAPAFVQDVTVAPDTTLGIQTGSFTVRYSRPMNTSTTPDLRIGDARQGTFENRGLPTGVSTVSQMAIDSKGLLWGVGTDKLFSYDGTTFQTYPTPQPANSYIADTPQAVAIGPGDVKWVLTQASLLRYDGQTWSRFTPCAQNMPCLMTGTTPRIAVTPDGAVWLLSVTMGTQAEQPVKFYRFDGQGWTTHIPEGVTASSMLTGAGLTVTPAGVVWAVLRDDNPSGTSAPRNTLLRFADGAWTRSTPQFPSTSLYQNGIQNLIAAADGTLWASLGEGLGHYVDGSWQFFKRPSSWMQGPGDGLAIDSLGVVWFKVDNGMASFDGHTWRVYRPSSGNFYSYGTLLIDGDGHKWFANAALNASGLYVFRDGYDTPVPAGIWLDDRTYQAGLDITALITRGPKRLLITGVRDSNDRIAADSRATTFTVDYAGQVSDRTAPPRPYVFASGYDGEAEKVRINYAASDAESAVDQVRYAIGSSPGAIDIVNWTNLPLTGNAPTPAAFAAILETSRSGLGLTPGSTYYVALQARNPGGLWSEVALSSFVAGQVTNPRAYIGALSPGQVPPGSVFTLTVTGYGFMVGSQVLWNGSLRPTIYVSPTELRASIGADDVAQTGTASVIVRNPAPGGGDSDPAVFTISRSGSPSGSNKTYLPFVKR